MSEPTHPEQATEQAREQATGADEPVELPKNAVLGVVALLLALVPVAFVGGWLARRRLDRMLMGL